MQRTVGRNIRAIRQARGLSQEAAADLLEHHRTYQGGLERGQRNISLRAVERLAAKLGVDPYALLSPDMTIEVDVRVSTDRDG